MEKFYYRKVLTREVKSRVNVGKFSKIHKSIITEGKGENNINKGLSVAIFIKSSGTGILL